MIGCGHPTGSATVDSSTGDGSIDSAAPDATPALPVCSCYDGAGLYCGAGVAARTDCAVPGLDANNLYRCDGTKTAPGTWSVAQACTMGCNVAPAGVDDSCKNPNSYYLPWAGGVTRTCTQGHNQGSHTGTGIDAWDFGMPTLTPIWASRAGTVSLVQFLGPNDACYNGVPVACTSCTSAGGVDCTNRGNYVVINHGDGTQALYLHLWEVDVTVGQTVHVGQQIAKSGVSGCACGPHLHYMVSSYAAGNYYSQSIASSFVEAGVPVSGQTITSQNP